MTASSSTSIGTRRFGRTNLKVSEIGLGCARIGGVFKRNATGFESLLNAALDGGITFFDTADIYSQGESEMLLGRAFKSRRERVVIASKVGYVLPAQRRLVARVKPLVRPLVRLLGLSRQHLASAVRGELTQDFSPLSVRNALEGSLRRLRTDYIDLLQLHSPPAEVVTAGGWLEALETLQRQGRIRYYGISCDTVAAADAALQYGGVSSLQLPVSLLTQDFLPVLGRAHKAGVAVIARESLANGLLVKDLTLEQIRRYCQTDEEAAAKAAQIEVYRREAAEAGLTLADSALRWVSRLEGVSLPIVGVSTPEQLQTLLAGVGRRQLA